MASNFLEILNKLHDHHVEFVIVGGVATILYGGSRLTFDLDIVPRLTQPSWETVVDFLWSLGARPRIPEPLERIRQADHVREWRQEKGMLALNFRTADGETEVDLLVSESDRFDELYARANAVAIGARTFRVAAVDDLIEMKRRAGRPQDVLDIRELERLQQRMRPSE